MNKKLDLNSSSINYEKVFDYDTFCDFGKRKKFAKSNEQPYMKRLGLDLKRKIEIY